MKKTELADIKNLSPTGVVLLDADGVVVPGRNSWQAIHDIMNTTSAGDEHYDLFTCGEISFEDWGHYDAELWAGRSIKPIRNAAERLDTVDGLTEAVDALHELGFRVGIISTGIHQYLQYVAERSGVDFIAANQLEVDATDTLTGNVHMQVIFDSKIEYLRYFAEYYSVELNQTVAVGDTKFDIEMFKSADLSIAFNPADSEVTRIADVIVEEEDLRNIIPPIQDWADNHS